MTRIARLAKNHQDVAKDLVWDAAYAKTARSSSSSRTRASSTTGIRTLGFQEAASLDDGDMWPVAYALQRWSAVVEKKVAKLVKAAVS